LHDVHPPHRVNVRHLPTIPLSKIGAINGPVISSNTATTNRFHANSLFLQSFTTTATNSFQQQQQQKKISSKQNKYGFEPLNSKPRTVTIVKQGNDKPHKAIRILINRRTAQTFEQLLSDISESFGYQKNRADKVRVDFHLILF
jgi:hypothetical protein